MKSDVIDQKLESSVTRRRVIGTGVKLAYAAPVVAASFKLNSAAAQGASPLCTPTTCGETDFCGRSPTCFCRTVDGVTRCLQDELCGFAAVCGADQPACPSGAVCVPFSDTGTGNCCDDKVSHCAFPCGVFSAATDSFGIAPDSTDRMFK
jgi:hypothetical protein